MKRIQRSKWALQLTLVLFLALGCVFGVRMQVKAAALSAPTNVKQTDAIDSAVQIEWEPVSGGVGTKYYYIMWGDSSNLNPESSSAAYTSERKCIIEGLKAGKTYYVEVGVSTTKLVNNKIPDDVVWSKPFKAVTSPEPISSMKYVDATTSSISVSWNKVSGATAYKVKYYKSDSSKAKVKVVKTNKIKLTGLTKNSLYDVTVCPIRKDPSGKFEATAINSQGYESAKGISGLPTLTNKKVTGLDCEYFNPSVKKGEVILSWNHIKTSKYIQPDGYQYEVCKYNSNKKLVTGHTTKDYVGITSNKLKARQYYKVRVRPYVQFSNGKKKYGSWSSWDYFARCADDDVNASLVNGNVLLTWKKVAGAQSYDVLWSTSASGSYQKITTVKGTNYTITIPIPYYKVYYVRIVPNRKVGKNNYTGVINNKSFYSTNFYKYQTYSY